MTIKSTTSTYSKVVPSTSPFINPSFLLRNLTKNHEKVNPKSNRSGKINESDSPTIKNRRKAVKLQQPMAFFKLVAKDDLNVKAFKINIIDRRLTIKAHIN